MDYKVIKDLSADEILELQRVLNELQGKYSAKAAETIHRSIKDAKDKYDKLVDKVPNEETPEQMGYREGYKAAWDEAHKRVLENIRNNFIFNTGKS